MVFATLASLMVVHNLAKVPYYLPVFVELPATNETWDSERCPVGTEDRWCFGMESSANFGSWFGYRAIKQFADPTRYLGPHVMMGSSCVMTMVYCWIQKTTLREASVAFFSLTTLTHLHVFPYRHGSPGRISGEIDPPRANTGLANLLHLGFITQFLAVVLFLCSRVVQKRSDTILLVAWSLSGFVVFAASALEFGNIALRGLAGFPTPEGDKPLQWAGDASRDPYASFGSPWMGVALTFVLFGLMVYFLITVGMRKGSFQKAEQTENLEFESFGATKEAALSS